MLFRSGFQSSSTFDLPEFRINTIKPYLENKLLIATNGAGVYLMDLITNVVEPYIVSNYETDNEINGKIIKDIFVDNENRIWMINFPVGITLRDKKFSKYYWIKHAAGNKQSLVNDKINSIIKDSEGDIWFTTNNGISLYKTKEEHWHSFFSSFNNDNKDRKSVV